MDKTLLNQAFETITQAERVAIILPSQISIDILASGVALQRYIEKLGHLGVILSSGQMPDRVDFLNPLPVIAENASDGRSMEIIVPTESSSLDQLSYQVESDGVHIFLTAKTGQFNPAVVKASSTDANFDLLVILGAQSFENLGPVYQQYAQRFFTTTKIVIDTNPSNTYFGTINLIDVTASSIGQLLTSIFLVNQTPSINPEIATSLLGAITAATGSFQDVKTTPQALSFAAELVKLGANQSEVVRSLYKTKPFSLLKIWGRALARLHIDETKGLMYTVLTLADFEKTEVNLSMVPQVLTELLEASNASQVVVVLAETLTGSFIITATLPHIKPQIILNGLEAQNIKALPSHGLYSIFTAEVQDLSPQTLELKLKQLQLS